jgi:hypothetical protein
MHAHNLTTLDPTPLTPERYDSNAYDQWAYDWMPKSLGEAVEDILQKIPERRQQTQVVVWNDGIWGTESYESILESLEQLQRSVGEGGQVIYKTTTDHCKPPNFFRRGWLYEIRC